MFNELISMLYNRGADIVKVIDISMLSENERRGYSIALLMGIALSREYIFRLTNNSTIDYSEFSEKENQSDRLAEWTADFITAKGYKAIAQSENILIQQDCYDESTKQLCFLIKKCFVSGGGLDREK